MCAVWLVGRLLSSFTFRLGTNLFRIFYMPRLPTHPSIHADCQGSGTVATPLQIVWKRASPQKENLRHVLYSVYQRHLEFPRLFFIFSRTALFYKTFPFPSQKRLWSRLASLTFQSFSGEATSSLRLPRFHYLFVPSYTFLHHEKGEMETGRTANRSHVLLRRICGQICKTDGPFC